MSDVFARLIERTQAVAVSTRPLLAPMFGSPYISVKEDHNHFEEQQAESLAIHTQHSPDQNRFTSHDPQKNEQVHQNWNRSTSDEPHTTEQATAEPYRRTPRTGILAQARTDARQERRDEQVTAGRSMYKAEITGERSKQSQRTIQPLDASDPSDFSEPLKKFNTHSLFTNLIPASAPASDARLAMATERRYSQKDRPEILSGVERTVARPIVRVTIGRIEVKAVTSTAPSIPQPAQTPRHEPMSLTEYLKQRNEGSR